jgi:hypothetical protein
MRVTNYLTRSIHYQIEKFPKEIYIYIYTLRVHHDPLIFVEVNRMKVAPLNESIKINALPINRPMKG